MPPERTNAPDGFVALLSRLQRRMAWRRDGLAASAGLIVGAAAVYASRLFGALPFIDAYLMALVCAVTAGAIVHLARRRPTAASAAARWERAQPTLRNVGVTALQLSDGTISAAPAITARVLTAAAGEAEAANVRIIVPLASTLLAIVGSLSLVVSAAMLPVRSVRAVRTAGRAPVAVGSRAAAPHLIATITPPTYTARPPQTINDPSAIEALAGSRLTLEWRGGEVAPAIRVNDGAIAPRRQGVAWRADAALSESGYVAIDAGSEHRLVALTVVPDRVPEVRITVPARDLRVSGATQTVPIEVHAADDLGLAALDVRYTVISGTGENFTFTEGTLPVSIVRGSERDWRASAALSLSALKLEPGDSLVYRATAADRRPGPGGTATSDTYFVEIAGPGDIALDAVDMPPDREKYALSEQMIVLKIERLRAHEKTMPRAAVVEEAGNIEAEQRAVRANFIFMLGGEVEDEDVEAQASTEIQEGRFANRPRQDIAAATVLMGRVQTALGGVSTRDALPLAKQAVIALQRAFGHSRYLLRALPSRARIDPSRRLSGSLADAAGWTRALEPDAADASIRRATEAAADLLDVSRRLDDRTLDAKKRLTGVAERVLAIDPGNAALTAAAQQVLAARGAIVSGHAADARQALSRALPPVLAVAERGAASVQVENAAVHRLAGAAARKEPRP